MAPRINPGKFVRIVSGASSMNSAGRIRPLSGEGLHAPSSFYAARQQADVGILPGVEYGLRRRGDGEDHKRYTAAHT